MTPVPRYSVYAFRFTATERSMLPVVGDGLDFDSAGCAIEACREAGATDWMIFSYQAVLHNSSWVPLSRPVVVESTLPREIEPLASPAGRA